MGLPSAWVSGLPAASTSVDVLDDGQLLGRDMDLEVEIREPTAARGIVRRHRGRDLGERRHVA